MSYKPKFYKAINKDDMLLMSISSVDKDAEIIPAVLDDDLTNISHVKMMFASSVKNEDGTICKDDVMKHTNVKGYAKLGILRYSEPFVMDLNFYGSLSKYFKRFSQDKSADDKNFVEVAYELGYLEDRLDAISEYLLQDDVQEKMRKYDGTNNNCNDINIYRLSFRDLIKQREYFIISDFDDPDNVDEDLIVSVESIIKPKGKMPDDIISLCLWSGDFKPDQLVGDYADWEDFYNCVSVDVFTLINSIISLTFNFHPITGEIESIIIHAIYTDKNNESKHISAGIVNFPGYVMMDILNVPLFVERW